MEIRSSAATNSTARGRRVRGRSRLSRLAGTDAWRRGGNRRDQVEPRQPWQRREQPGAGRWLCRGAVECHLTASIAGAWHDTDTRRTVTLPGPRQARGQTSTPERSAAGSRAAGATSLLASASRLMPRCRCKACIPRHMPSAPQPPARLLWATLRRPSPTPAPNLDYGLTAGTCSPTAPSMKLRGRVAWVHDFDPESRINAVFRTLPGANFTVDGAAGPRNAALTSAVAELRMRTAFH